MITQPREGPAIFGFTKASSIKIVEQVIPESLYNDI